MVYERILFFGNKNSEDILYSYSDQSNGNFHHHKNFASEAGFAAHCKQKIFPV